MFRLLDLLLLLLFCPVSYNGTTPRSVSGKKGGNSTLPCEFEASEISHIRLIKLSKNIHVCENEQCENGRVVKEGSCDIIIKDLRFSDAGKYILRFNYKKVQNKEKTYQLQIHDEIPVNTGEKLKMDVLLTNAEKVVHESRINKEVWTRNSSVDAADQRLTVRDGNLTIIHFDAIDAGTYRVLDSKGQTLITVTVTESSKDSAGEHKDDPKTKSSTESSKDSAGKHKDDPKTTVEPLVIGLSVGGALAALALAVALAAYFIWKSKCQNRNADNGVYQDVPMEEIVQDSNITGYL